MRSLFVWIDLGLSCFYIVFPPLLALFRMGHTFRLRKKEREAKILLYYLVISVGIQGLLTGLFEIFFPSWIAETLQLPMSPFLTELGMANVAFGFLGILCPWMTQGWRMATAVGYGLFLLMTGLLHLVRIGLEGASPGDVGGFLLFDLVLSLLLLTLAARNDLTLRI